MVIQSPDVTRAGIASFLAKGRQTLHLSQAALAKEWGVSRAMIARFESPRGPTVPRWVLYAMYGMLVSHGGGKLLEVVTDLLPRQGPVEYRPLQRESSQRWRHAKKRA